MLAVDGEAENHEAHAERVAEGRDLGEHHDPDHYRGRGQKRDAQRVRGPCELPHCELIADVRYDRGRDADTDPGRDRSGVEQAARHRPAADRRHDGERDDHRQCQAVDTTESWLT
jgi:hypothetical protein